MATTNTPEKIVVLGYGWVGQANALALRRMGYEVAYYDVITPRYHYSDTYYALYEQVRALEKPLDIDSPDTWYIVCIGDRVSMDGVQDISLIENALQSLVPAQGKIILRSTVLPNLLSGLRFDVYVPEFLHELYAVDECLNPYYFIIGQRSPGSLPSFLKEWQKRAQRIFIGSPEEASHIKYLSNIWNAVRIAFVNEFGNSIAIPESNADREHIEKIIDFFFEKKNYLRYGKTFGGHCLPKDLRAYTRLIETSHPSPILRATLASNAEHQKIVDRLPLPEWFSGWDYETFGTHLFSSIEKKWRRLNELPFIRHIRSFLKPIAARVMQYLFPTNALDTNKRLWNTLATKNPFYYAHSDTKSRQKVDEFELRETGVKDYEQYISEDNNLRTSLQNNTGTTCLEIGCGVGRITEQLAKQCSHVTAVDISPIMLSIAKKRLSNVPNITFLETEGNRLPVQDNSVGIVFSSDTFNHLPSPVIISDYLKEVQRILVPEGMAKIQLRTGQAVYRWRWFYGVSLTPDEVRTLVETTRLTLVDLTIENNKSLWITVKKNNTSSV